MRRLSSVDAQFVAMEDGRTHAHICQLTILESADADGRPFTIDTLRTVIGDRLHLLRPFRCRLKKVPFDLDYPVFVQDTDVDLDAHLWELAVPEPGGPAELGELVGQIASRPLDRDRPLWEVYLITGLAAGRVALLTKLHHCLVDGVSGIELLSTILDPSPQGRDVEPEDPRASGWSRTPSDLELLVRGVAALPRQQARMVRALPGTLRHLDQLPTMRSLPGGWFLSAAVDRTYRLVTRGRDGDSLERTAGAAPRVSLGGRIGAHRRFAYGTLDLALVTAIKQSRPGMTVNDVVVALCAGALRRRLQARGDRVTGPLVAMVPISIREKDSTYGNHISSLMVEVPTDEADPLARLDRAHDIMACAKARHRAMPARLLQDANETVPPALFARAARAISTTTANGWIDPPFNVTISNLPGARSPLYCGGVRVVSQHPVNVLLDGVGVSLTLLSYQDRLDFGLTADRDLVPDVWPLEHELRLELAELAAAAGVDGVDGGTSGVPG